MPILPVVMLLAPACVDQPPADGCAEGYGDGYDQGFGFGAGCAPLNASVECSSEAVDFCDYEEAYSHCFGIGLIDGYADGKVALAEDCDVSVDPCTGGFGECI
jgi:hypothetical protein